MFEKERNKSTFKIKAADFNLLQKDIDDFYETENKQIINILSIEQLEEAIIEMKKWNMKIDLYIYFMKKCPLANYKKKIGKVSTFKEMGIIIIWFLAEMAIIWSFYIWIGH